ncbi:histidine kinase [Rhodoferax sp. GW822-FHT02A01]|uniref:sensor histidine kinase n=1 Tax=Rhodoferax sp. GW822-FHT02A01 TaxID=3141537 RepID=UPI00315D0107
MEDTQILSTLPEQDPANERSSPAPVLVFDACQIGVVLRALLFVEAAIGVVTLYGSPDALAWLSQLSLVTGGALPAVLAWLLLTCMSKRLLARIPVFLQYTLATLLGGVVALYGCGLLAFTGLVASPPWLASFASGVFLSGVVVGGLVLRAKGRTPAHTAARLAELQSRIQPHFLFNTLNSAIALVRAEPAKAEALLEDLSDLFRHALMDRTESVTLADEIALARRYLDIEQVRFGDRLQLEWNLDPQADGARLPPLLLQPLVENAVRHGVEPSDTGAMVRISTQRRGSVVVIKVSNTVPAGPGRAGAGEALRNVRERLALLHDVQGRFSSGMRDGVFQVRMEVPV